MKKLLTCVLIMIFLSGCVTMPTIYPIRSDDVFNADYDQIWTATMQALAELNFPMRVADKSSGVITTDYVNFSTGDTLTYAQYNRPLLDQYGKLNLNITIIKNVSSNTVKVISNIEVWCGVGQYTNHWEVRPSNGYLESTILNKIRSKVAGTR